MTPVKRNAVRRRFLFRCGYCGIGESDAGSELTIDHHVPQSAGGSDDLENLVYACHACNGFKGDYWENDPPLRLLHPFADRPDAHCRSQSDGSLRPTTESGRVFIERLRLNRPQLIQHRLKRQQAERDERELRALREAARTAEARLVETVEEVQRRAEG